MWRFLCFHVIVGDPRCWLLPGNNLHSSAVCLSLGLLFFSLSVFAVSDAQSSNNFEIFVTKEHQKTKLYQPSTSSVRVHMQLSKTRTHHMCHCDHSETCINRWRPSRLGDCTCDRQSVRSWCWTSSNVEALLHLMSSCWWELLVMLTANSDLQCRLLSKVPLTLRKGGLIGTEALTVQPHRNIQTHQSRGRRTISTFVFQRAQIASSTA